MSYDVQRLRARFPALAEGAAHFDAPGGTQVPTEVATAVAGAMTSALANRGRTTAAERRADHIVRDARAAMADLLGAEPGGIVFGRSATQLTFDLARTLAKDWGPGDEVVVTRLDHDANIRPWVLAAAAVGAQVRWADFDPATGELTLEDLARVLTDRTRLVALTAASNLIGTRPDVAAVSALAHRAGALVAVDGVHATAHTGTDITALGADFYVCSPYKFLGPHLGVLAAAPERLAALKPDKLAPASDAVPERLELGTLPYELLAGVTATVDLIADLAPAGPPRRDRVLTAMGSIERHEDALRVRIEQGLAALGGVTVYSRASRRTPTLLLRVAGVPDRQVSTGLAERGINAPSGSFYALEASRHLGLGDDGAVRLGLAPYSDGTDVDRLLGALAEMR